jgi:CRISPR-associated protein Cas2
MWLLAMFDLPVMTDVDKKRSTQFRKDLEKLGFNRLQYSVYAYFCPSAEVAGVIRKNVSHALPPNGQVRIVGITDKQFGKMDVFEGKKRVEPEEAPEQILLF